jgi:hypothetical protein
MVHDEGTSWFQPRLWMLDEIGPLHGTGMIHRPQALDFNALVKFQCYSVSRPVGKGQRDRKQCSTVAGFLTGHCTLSGHIGFGFLGKCHV